MANSDVPKVKFHSSCGSLIALSVDNLTASRCAAGQEFNNGLVFSETPLEDDFVFSVRIDERIVSWTGSIEIGLIGIDPQTLSIPTSTSELTESVWIVSGSNVLKDGVTIKELYGPDLDSLKEGDSVGIMRTKEGDLVLYVNERGQGIGASNLPRSLYAIINLYGKCTRVTILPAQQLRFRAPIVDFATLTFVSSPSTPPDNGLLADPSPLLPDNELPQNDSHESNVTRPRNPVSTSENTHRTFPSFPTTDRLKFHARCGSLIKLSSNGRTAERRRPMDEFNHGVVMSHRAIKDNELFHIRIDRLVDKWSGSIEVGVTTHDPATLDFPATMTNLRSGTVIMSGCGILTNGKGSRREYGEVNLDQLTEGDTIGLIRKPCGSLHFFVNGQDQGLAATLSPEPVWAVVDLYGMAVKVTILDSDRSPREEHNIAVQRGLVPCAIPNELWRPLTFSTRCGTRAAVVNAGKTAHRPNALEDFNHGVVLTARPLRPGEIFEVRLDKVVTKWAGSIEIGVTSHEPSSLEFPTTMTNVRSGTWMMTGNGVMHNGVTVLDDYGRSLDRLKVGDRVAVQRLLNGVLHFYVNGEDQGPAAYNVPYPVYGVIDLYGQAAEATIVDRAPLYSPETEAETESPDHVPSLPITPPLSSPSPSSSSLTLNRPVHQRRIHSDLAFHHLHGRNALVSNGGLTASRPNAHGEFNDAIVITQRPLKAGELFEIVIERIVDRWSGSLELGVTIIRPEDLDFPATMTDIGYDTWMLSGAAVMQDGIALRHGYPLDLDTLTVGSKVGLLRHGNGSLHYYLNGQDQGKAFDFVPPSVYAVIDLYGQCAQVSLVHSPLRETGGLEAESSPACVPLIATSPLMAETVPSNCHRFHAHTGKAIYLSKEGRSAQRVTGEFENGLLFSAMPLRPEEVFEVELEEVEGIWCGGLAIGVTSRDTDELSTTDLPARISELQSPVWFGAGLDCSKLHSQVRHAFLPLLTNLVPGDRVALWRTSDGCLKLSVNGKESVKLFQHLPRRVYAVLDLFGAVTHVSIQSTRTSHGEDTPDGEGEEAMLMTPLPSSISQLALREAMQGITAALGETRLAQGINHACFHDYHGRNILLSMGNAKATRQDGYNHGLVFSQEPLKNDMLYHVRLDKLEPKWTGSIKIGIVSTRSEKLPLPTCSLDIKRAWILSENWVYRDGVKFKRCHFNLDKLQVGQNVGVRLSQNQFHVYIDGLDQGAFTADISQPVYAVMDLYGQCEQVTVLSSKDIETDQEKANQDNSEKLEAAIQLHTPILDVVDTHLCSYRAACLRFRDYLGLPTAFFVADAIKCYCSNCTRGQASDSKSLQLQGFCRLPLRFYSKNSLVDGDKWAAAFYTVKWTLLRNVLDKGTLQVQPTLSGCQPGTSSEKNRDASGLQMRFYPSLLSAIPSAPIMDYPDHVLNRNLKAQAILQVAVKPGSYTVERSTVEGHDLSTLSRSALPAEDNGGVWVSKEEGAAVAHAILLRFQAI